MQDRTLASKRVRSSQQKTNRYYIQKSRWRLFQLASVMVFMITIGAIVMAKTGYGLDALPISGVDNAIVDVCSIILVAYLIIYLLAVLIHTSKHRFSSGKYLNKRIGEIDRMDGSEFERYLAAHFRRLGYDVTEIGGANDYGADLILRKRGRTTVVQAKRYKGGVSNTAVQEVHGARTFYKADAAMVVTNSYFTKNAQALADACDVILWDRNSIKQEFGIKGRGREKIARNSDKNGA